MKITTIANTIAAKLTKVCINATEAKILAWTIIALIYIDGIAMLMQGARSYMLTFTWAQATNDLMTITQNAIQQLGALLCQIY